MEPLENTFSDFVDGLESIFTTRGAWEYLGEEVSIAEHMIQAAMRAEESSPSDLLIVAALLHDIGHLVQTQSEAEDWDRDHDVVGAAYLAPHFGPAVVEPVRLHVQAKRYLCLVEPGYRERLSPASVHTLSLQGGVMSTQEAKTFESNSHHRGAVQIRRWDDSGKNEGISIRTFSHFRATIERVRSKALSK